MTFWGNSATFISRLITKNGKVRCVGVRDESLSTEPIKWLEMTRIRVCVRASYVVVVHEFSAEPGQSTGEKLSRFNGRWGQFRTTLKQDTI